MQTFSYRHSLLCTNNHSKTFIHNFSNIQCYKNGSIQDYRGVVMLLILGGGKLLKSFRPLLSQIFGGPTPIFTIVWAKYGREGGHSKTIPLLKKTAIFLEICYRRNSKGQIQNFSFSWHHTFILDLCTLQFQMSRLF